MEENFVEKKPMDYLKIVFRRKWLIIIPTVIGIIISIIAANTLPKTYESATLVLVEEGRVINPLIQGLTVSTSVAQRLALLREQILGWDRVNQLIKKLNLSKDVKTQQDFEDLVKRLRRNIKVKLRGQSIISISYAGANPVQAMNIVKTITDIFIQENLNQQTRETENAISFINDQLELYKKKLKQGDVSVMEEQLDKLLVDSTEKHPMVIQLRKQISAVKGEIDKGDYTIAASSIAGSDAELSSMRQELSGIKGGGDSTFEVGVSGENRSRISTSTDDKLYKLLLLEKIDTITQRDTGVNQTLYNELLKRLETAKLTQRLEASRDGTRYTVLDPARLPLEPVSPNKVMVLLMGVFFGMFGGFGLVVATEVFDHSFMGVEDAKMYLEHPILGSTSKIITEKDLKIQKFRNIKIASISVLTGAILLVVIIFNVLLGS